MAYQFLYDEINNKIEITGIIGIPEGELLIPDEIEECTVTKICEKAFSGCSRVKSITVPETVEEIEQYAFENCSALEEIIIPENVRIICEGLFYGCSSLKKINIHSEVSDIEEKAFLGCTSLQKITVSGENVWYSDADGILFDREGSMLICYPAGRNDSSYTVSESVLTIGKYAFACCEHIEKVKISEGVQDIYACAFVNCRNLKSVSVPESAMWLDEYCLGYTVSGEEYEKAENELVMYVHADSEAVSYAEDNGIKYYLVNNEKLREFNENSSHILKNISMESLIQGIIEKS